MNSICLTRLRKEFKELQKKPVENIRAAPKESNILEWHYVIEGPKKSVYEGGWYHGTLVFPSEYPYKPPSIQMFTPNGRFKWSVGTILMGLYSFMLEETVTYGSIETSDSFRRKCARESHDFNVTNKMFCELFPELVEIHAAEKKRLLEIANDASTATATTTTDGPTAAVSSPSVNNAAAVAGAQQTSWAAMIGMLAAIIACTWAILALL